MNFLFPFLIKSFLSSGILVAYYCITLRNKKIHSYNRFYLLFAIAASLVLPLIRSNTNYIPIPKFVSDTSRFLVGSFTHGSSSGFTPQIIFLLIYSLVFLIFFGILSLRIISMCRLIRRCQGRWIDGVYFIETDDVRAPFSYFSKLIWRRNILVDSESGKRIFRHELAHIKGKHTYDKMFVQIVICLFWINPFYWFMQRELNTVHEFIADSKSIEQDDANSFAEMLLTSYNNGTYMSPAHYFFETPVSRRLKMFTDGKYVSHARLRQILVVPLVCCLFFILSSAQLAPPLKNLSADQKVKAEREKKLHDEMESLKNTRPGG